MLKRPGQKTTGCTGCLFIIGCLVLLFSLSVGHGDVAITVMRVIGGVLVAAGLYQIFAGSKAKPLTVTSTGARGWEQSPWFPKLPTGKHALSGVRLNQESRPIPSLVGITIFALLWNGGVFGGFAAYYFGARTKTVPALLWVGFAVFAIIGLLIVVGLLRQLALVLFVGDTHLDLPHEPLVPGQSVTATLFQAGSFPITSLTCTLICTEVVTYRQGTDTVVHREKVHDQVVHEQRNLASRGGQALTQFNIKVPLDAVPSFASPNNKIEWHLEVKMDIPNRPDVEAKFPLRICPP